MRSFLFFSALRNVKPTGPIDDASTNFMMAIEMMHLASCMVDDIIDGDGIRHGRPSSHARIGDTNAILDSHLLVCGASKRMLEVTGKTQIPDLINRFHQTYHDLCIGEGNDVFRYGIPDGGYCKDVYQKTSAMFRFIMESAAVMRKDGTNKDLFGNVGESIGKLYQVSNDFWDTQIRNQKLRNKGNNFQVTCSMPLAEHVAEHGMGRIGEYIEKGSLNKEEFYSFLRKMWTPKTRIRAKAYFESTIKEANSRVAELSPGYLKELTQTIIETVVKEEYWYHPI